MAIGSISATIATMKKFSKSTTNGSRAICTWLSAAYSNCPLWFLTLDLVLESCPGEHTCDASVSRKKHEVKCQLPWFGGGGFPNRGHIIVSLWNVPLADIDLGDDEINAVTDVLRSKWLSMGPVTAEFERQFG